MHIDLALGESYLWFQGSFELSTPDTLLLQRKLIGITDPVRPTMIQAKSAFNYRKETNSTELPSENTPAEDQMRSISLREQSGRDYVIKMMFAQRYYGDRDGTYATRFQQIHPGLYDEDIDYRYQIVPKAPHWIWITAQAKHPELRSFTGQVIAGNVFPAPPTRLPPNRRASSQTLQASGATSATQPPTNSGANAASAVHD